MNVRIFALSLVVALLGSASPLLADRIVLTNGNVLVGKVLSEDDTEVVILLHEGMKMTVERGRIREIVPEAETGPPDPPPETGGAPTPDEPKPPEPDSPPEHSPKPPRHAPPEAGKVPHVGTNAGLFKDSPGAAWEHRHGRCASLTGAKVTAFRAYAYVDHSPLSTPGDDPTLRSMVLEHGHGGSLAVWKFRYVGVREFKYGDKVKIVAELTSPRDPDRLLLHLEGGPDPFAPRMQVILIRRGYSVQRYVTTTVFTNRDFKRRDLDDLGEKPVRVRTFREDFRSVCNDWVSPGQVRILDELKSPFGKSVRVQLERYRFRVSWYAKSPADRPPLDAGLLAVNHVLPLAASGQSGASEREVRRHWGTAEANRGMLDKLKSRVLDRLARLGVKPGAGYHVECDRLQDSGPTGITLRTRRYSVPAALLREIAGL